MGEVLQAGTYDDKVMHPHCTLYKNTKRKEFYRVLINPLNQEKFIRVNNELNQALINFNEIEVGKSRRFPEQFPHDLAKYKRADKYNGKNDEEVRLRDRKKPLEEIGVVTGKHRNFSQTVIAYSCNNIKRILGFGYVSEDGKKRVYVRYSTFKEKPRSAEEVIACIRAELGLPILTSSPISE